MGGMKIITVSLTLFVSIVLAERSSLPNLGISQKIVLPNLGYKQNFFRSNPENVEVRVTKTSTTPVGFSSQGEFNTQKDSPKQRPLFEEQKRSSPCICKENGNNIGFGDSTYASSSSNSKVEGGYDYSSQSGNYHGGTYSFSTGAEEEVPVDSLPYFDHNLHEPDNHVPPFAIIPVNISHSEDSFQNQNRTTPPPRENFAQTSETDLPQGFISTQDRFNTPLQVPVEPFQPFGPVLSGPSLEQLLEQDWNDFTTRFNKVYPSEQEARYRREIFIENRAKIMRFNTEYAEGRRSFVHKINEFADMLLHEFSENFNGFNRSNKAPSVPLKPATTFLPSANVVFPDSVDWRIVGAVGPVKSQGNCAACWAFAAAGALEGHHFRKTGSLVEVSPQNLIDCTQPYGNNGCSGGLMDPAFEYIRDNNGVDSDPSYPFEQKNGQCRFKRENVVATCTGFVDIGQNDEKGLEIALATLGPVTAAIDAGQETFQFYSEGIYDDPKCGNKPEQMNHAVLIVGYGQEADGRKYWLVKNSYGPNWGIGGYIKIAKENNNQCGIAIQASYPLV